MRADETDHAGQEIDQLSFRQLPAEGILLNVESGRSRSSGAESTTPKEGPMRIRGLRG